MIKIEKNNIVISISEDDLKYYRAQGYKIVGEDETKEKTPSLTKFKKLESEIEKLKVDLEEANSKIEALSKNKVGDQK